MVRNTGKVRIKSVMSYPCFFCPQKCQLTKTGKLEEGSCNLGISFRGRVFLPGSFLFVYGGTCWWVWVSTAGIWVSWQQSSWCSQTPMAPKTPKFGDKVGSYRNLGGSRSEQGFLPGSAAAVVLPSNLRLSQIFRLLKILTFFWIQFLILTFLSGISINF